MKTFKSFFAFFLVSALVLFVDSCKKDSSEELGSFIEADAKEFKNQMDRQGEGVQIVDFRSKAEFDAGHIPGAESIPADLENTASNSSSFCQEVLQKFNTNKPIFLYGKEKGNAHLQRIVPGRVSKIGFGDKNTCVLMGGFEAWEKAFPSEVVK